MTNGFGDRHATITPILYRQLNHSDLIIKSKIIVLLLSMVGAKRLELLHLAALEPKSSASTNFATPHLGHLFKINVAEDQGLEP